MALAASLAALSASFPSTIWLTTKPTSFARALPRPDERLPAPPNPRAFFAAHLRRGRGGAPRGAHLAARAQGRRAHPARPRLPAGAYVRALGPWK
jgi:hypothetical protein